jgi:hypothetical protein
VEDDQLRVAGQAQIEFVGVGPLRPAEPEGGERVFRRVVRSASMTDDFDDRKLEQESRM